MPPRGQERIVGRTSIRKVVSSTPETVTQQRSEYFTHQGGFKDICRNTYQILRYMHIYTDGRF